ncbi:LysR substrate-binding domain-containing protein, partial [Thalassospira lucentensis]
KDRKWVFFSQSGPQSITAQGNLRLNHYPLIRNATVQGLGVARLPRYVAMPEIHAGRLETALEEYRSPLRPIYLVYAYQGNLPVKNRLMIDFIRNWFTDRPDLLETNGPNSV